MSFLDEFSALINSGVSNKGPVGKLRGKDLSESVTDAPQLKKFEGTEPSRVAAEAEALTGPTIGPISIDPTDYLTPGGLAKVGAAVGKTLTGAAASAPMLVGAFRSANDTMISRKIINDIAKHTEFAKVPGRVEKAIIDGDPTEALDYLLHSKLSTKEGSKYGTPEFVLDKWLWSTQHDPNHPLALLKPVTSKSIGSSAEAGLIRSANQDLIGAVKDKEEALALGDTTFVPIYDKLIAKSTERIQQQGMLFEDLDLANKQGKTLLHSRYNHIVKDDIGSAFYELQNSIMKYDIPVKDLQNKSLQQIASIVHKKDDESVRILKRSMEAKNQTITARTAELFNTQRDPDAGMFVKLTDPKDLAHETDILNHCIGAVGRDNEKYIPAFDTVTGQPNKGTSHSSFSQYSNALAAGKSEFYSYRPKGLPEFTIEVSPPSWNGERIIAQAYGKEDAALNPEQLKALESFSKAKGITFTKDIGRLIDDNGGDDWIPDDDIPF